MYYSLLLFVVISLVLAKIVSLKQQCKIQFYLSDKNNLMQKFISKPEIANMKFTPFILALNGHLQGFWFLWYKIVKEHSMTANYERELFTLSDGQQIGIDWCLDNDSGIPKPDQTDKRPILACVAGQGGSNQACYVKAMIEEARSKNFKCVFILFRGSDGVPITQGKLYSHNSWKDIKEPVDYLFSKYCAASNRKLYLFGCSLGGTMASNYLCNDPNSPLSGAVIYGAPMNLVMCFDFLKQTMWGIYDTVFGYDAKAKFAEVLPQLEKQSTPEQYASYKHCIENEDSKVSTIGGSLMAPMFGYKNSLEYCKASTFADKLQNINVPCFYLHAQDDIILPPESVPVNKFQENPNLLLGTTDRGGHCCHIHHGRTLQSSLLPVQWFPQPLVEYLVFLEQSHKKLE